MLLAGQKKNLGLFAAVAMYCFIHSKVTCVNCSLLFCVGMMLFFCFGVGNFFLLFSLVVFVVLSAGCVMNVDFNFSF